MNVLVLAAVLCASTAFGGFPRLMLRLSPGNTETDARWAETLDIIRRAPGCCDDVWFSTGTGVPHLSWHRERAARIARASSELRAMGIGASLQVQATIGHGDAPEIAGSLETARGSRKTCPAKAWTGWTGSTGVECVSCNCPRQPGFLDYYREVAEIYAAARPSAVWIDDDLRPDNHLPATKDSLCGCWCATCVAAFNAETGGAWTREALARAMAGDERLAQLWRAFTVRALVKVAHVIAEAVHRVSPETRVCLQNACTSDRVELVRALLVELHAVTGLPTAFRAGGYAYYDLNPNDQVCKSLEVARFRKEVGEMGFEVPWCCEIESWPRAYGSRSARSVLVEGFTALMYGLDAISYFTIAGGVEPSELYLRTMLKPIADASSFLRDYARACDGTRPVGYSSASASVNELCLFAYEGIPVLPGVGRSVGTVPPEMFESDFRQMTSASVQVRRAKLDALGRSLVVVDSPFVGLVAPREADDGTLKTVALLNTRIDAQGPVGLRLRGLPSSVASVTWRALRGPSCTLPVGRSGGEARVVVPEIGPWDGGYLSYERPEVAAPALLAGALSNRWVYVSVSMTEDRDVETVSNVVQMAKAGGFNGLVLSCGLDFLRFWPKDRLDRLMAVKRLCADSDVEIVPAIWSFGYGALQNYGVDALEGVPVEGSPFVATERALVFDEAAAVRRPIDAKPAEWQKGEGRCRTIQRLAVTPHRRYRYRFEFRTDGLVASQPFKVSVVDCVSSVRGPWHENERLSVSYAPTQDWTSVTFDFNSADSDAYFLYTGFWGGVAKGDLALRRQTLTEIPPCDVLRRPGTPRVLRSAANGRVYEEGRDYVVPPPRHPVWEQGRAPVRLERPAGSSIADGERLVFDAYAPAVVDGQQVSTCLSEPDLYVRVAADSAAQVERLLAPKSWLVSMDEFRNGGTCAACRARGLDMAQIYADAVTRLCGVIRRAHPGADILLWGDMLDPNHNGVSCYYNCRGSFADAWRGVPKDVTVVCWNGLSSDRSLKFFSEHGFRTLAAAYYDEKPPFEHSRRWRDLVRRTEGARGILYTTWRQDYRDLPAFMKMVNDAKEGQ